MEILNYILRNSHHIYILLPEIIIVSRRLFEKRSRFNLRLLIFIPYLILPYFGLYNISWMQVGNWFNIAYQIVFFVSLGLMEFLYKISFKYLLFLGVFAYAAQQAADCLARVLYFTVRPDYVNYIEIMYHGMEIGSAILIYLLLYVAVAKKVGAGAKLRINNLTVVLLGVVVLVAMNVLGWYTFERLDEHFVVMRAYGFLCSAVVIFLQFTLFVKGEQEMRSEVMENILRTQRAQNEMSRETVELINIKCHDLKHQIGALRRQEGVARDKSIAEIEKSVMIYDSFVKTGNETLDVVLTQKNIYGERYGIKFACMIDGAALSFMDDADIYSLFGNIIDNAIAAVSACVEDERVIDISAGVRGGVPFIHSENYFSGKLEFEDGLPVTSGDRRYHGFGMQSIRYIAGRYGGNMTASAHGNIFELNIIFASEEGRKRKKEK